LKLAVQGMIIGCLRHCSPTKPERCLYGHSLAPGMPQKISWLPCICDPAREAAERGRGMGHVTLWCGKCSDQDRRDTRFYEPPRRARAIVVALDTRVPARHAAMAGTEGGPS
jgi:hypothetical protein